jgi:hypothetical protein
MSALEQPRSRRPDVSEVGLETRRDRIHVERSDQEFKQQLNNVDIGSSFEPIITS